MRNIKILILIIIIFNICFGINLESQVSVYNANFIGDCNNSDTTKHFESVNYIHSEYPSSTFSTVTVGICNSTNYHYNVKFRVNFSPKKDFIYNSSTYTIDTNQITLHKIFTAYDSTSAMDYHVFELRDKSSGNLLAIEYGSNNKNSDNKFLSYLMVCDSINPYASNYIGANLTFTAIYNYGNSYLFEITDDDRSGMLVGLKYKSPFSTTVYEKYLVPKP